MSLDINFPLIAFGNLFLADPTAEAFLRHWMGSTTLATIRPHLVSMGERAAAAQPLAATADKHGPSLETHDARGIRVDRVVYHPAYHELEELAYGGGIVALKYEPSFLAEHGGIRHLTGFALGYLFGQSECGLFCPVCMTDGVGRVLERHAPEELARETIKHLSSRSRAGLWQGAMFLTEKQGGSDVGANAAEARDRGGKWYLRGDKWFCSNVDAEAILALARMPGGPPGTRGLGLFLVLRHRPTDNGATIRIHRLKEKLGVRSMPTGEVTFEDTEAYLIGGKGEGFKQMAEMLNLSRLYNAVASVAGMRRGILEALAYGAERRAFGAPLWELPLWRATMADLQAEFLGMFALVFETVRALDRADGGDAEAQRLVRLTTPMVKALAGKAAIFTISECMEAIGGNAYIEESILPRLLRDAQVLPIWEGTTHILTLDAMRAIQKQSSHEALFARIGRALDNALLDSGVPADLADAVAENAAQSQRMLAELASSDIGNQQRGARAWLEQAGRTLSLALLLETACDPVLRTCCLAASRRMLARPFFTAPVCSRETSGLIDTEEPLLRAGFDITSRLVMT